MNIIKTATAPSTPGIYSGLSNAAYHAGPGISKSGLDLLARSPLHYWDRYINPQPTERTETAAMAFGTAVHAAVLEPDEFAKWVVMDKVDGRTTVGKAAKAEAEARAAQLGVPMIDTATWDTVQRIAARVHRHPQIGAELQTGTPELSVYWTDEDTGILCRCRPDWLGKGIVVDIKTTENASPKAFQQSAYGWRYWVQAAYYLDGLATNGVDIEYFLFAAVEKSSPFAVMGYTASKAMLDSGRREYQRLLRLYAICASTNEWPGYGGVMDLELPSYAPERMDRNNAVAFEVETF